MNNVLIYHMILSNASFIQLILSNINYNQHLDDCGYFICSRRPNLKWQMSTPISQTRADLVPLIANKYRDILRDLGEDTNREGLLDTPSRAAQALLFFTKVIKIQNTDVRF